MRGQALIRSNSMQRRVTMVIALCVCSCQRKLYTLITSDRTAEDFALVCVVTGPA